MYKLHFAYPHIFYIFIPLWIAINLYRWKFYRSPIYTYPLASQIKKTNFLVKTPYKKILFSLRSLLLFSIIFLIARPQWVDSRSQINIDGVDILITLDVSGSMQLFDDLKDRRQRITIAKKEAIKFINKRHNDPIGIVIFGADAVSYCPRTLDKQILKETIENIKIGIINHSGTSLGTGIATAINKLKTSKAKSKVIILLTDGEPTPRTEKIPVETAVDLAKNYGVKIYCIGIGNKKGAFVPGAFGFIQRAEDSVDEELLKKIASQTGGRFFRANNAKEMTQIYNTIDKLEKTEYKTNLFSRYYEAFNTFIWIILLLFMFEFILKFIFWRGLL